MQSHCTECAIQKLCLSDTNRGGNDDPFDSLDMQAVEDKASVWLEMHAASDG